MPHASRTTAAESVSFDGLDVKYEALEGGYTAGDAYYVPPGHTPVHYAGAEIVEFSPTDMLGEAMGVVMRNLGVGA